MAAATFFSDRARRGAENLLHAWVPVVLALVVAAAAGWGIVRLDSRAASASEAAQVTPALEGDLRQPAQLLLDTARQRLAARGSAARAPEPMLATSIYFSGTFLRLAWLRRETDEKTLVDAVSRALHSTSTTTEQVAAGGVASRYAALRAPAEVAALRSSLATLDQDLAAHSRVASRFARGGTMLIMLLAALTVIALLRHYDRIRRRLTDELHLQATHDPLTGLANRRQLATDLDAAFGRATAERPARLVVFDLDGFKAYNDGFGHPGGDLLLTRLARALEAALGRHGSCYRLGGDEFCALLTDVADAHAMVRCVDALSESGEAFSISSSHGSVLLPTEAPDAASALRIADERMYADKNSVRASAAEQTRNLAMKMLTVQEPALERHSMHVAALAEGVGRRLGLGAVDLSDLVRAAELHDIGKIAIPFAVLHKAGPLAEAEWELMRSHTSVGATILGAAPALERVAEIVRNGHERFDGRGYPRGLAGSEIPLASRIVFVCDAFDAMLSDRPYSSAVSDEAALDQLRRGSGTQFDADVVAAFVAEYGTASRVRRARAAAATA